MEDNKKATSMNSLGVMMIVAAALLLLIVLVAVFSNTCDECHKAFLGKGYYSSKVLSNPDEGVKVTLCESCAFKDWLPFNYRNYEK